MRIDKTRIFTKYMLLFVLSGCSGKAMKAKDTLYHEDGCFVCAECSLDLREVAVYAKDAALYCEKHYKEKFVPKCARCLDYITEVSLSVRRSPDNMTFALQFCSVVPT